MAFPEGVSASILAYAERLRRVFSRLGVLSGTGIQMDRQFHATVRLYRCDPADERARNYRQSDMVVGGWGQAAAKTRGHLTGVEAEAPALSRWLSSGHQSLILIAPFGAGKSVVLETFARSLADGLLSSGLKSLGSSSPLVPLPVRLRAWKWHEGEPFEGFLLRSQTLLDGDRLDGMLDPEVFRLLLAEGSILPLLDGFDELPGGFDCRDGTSPRQKATTELRRLFLHENGGRCRVVVATRPGYGVENDSFFSRDDRLTISEYTESEIREYISARFPAAGDRGTLAAAARAFARAEPDIREMLSRPLFLGAWCDRVADDTGSAPQSVTEIMRVLIARTIDPVRLKHAIGLPTEQAKLFEGQPVTQHSVLRRVPQLGAFLAIFARRRFGEAIWFDDVAGQTAASLPGLSNDEIQRIVAICTHAGFATLMDDGYAYAIKVPVVEFLVGQFLASQADEDRGRSFVETFRRWVWMPDLHDCLFFAMESLRTGSPERRWIANECCQWLLSASAASTPAATGPLPDDVLRPFIVLAARLGADVDAAASALVEHRFLADKYFENVSVPILAGLRGPLVTPYVKALLRVAAGRPGASHLSRVQETLRVAGPRVIGEHVRDFIEALANYPGDDEQTELRCEIAIEDAVVRLPEGEVEVAVADWFSRLGSAGRIMSKRLQMAISAASRLVDRAAAAQAVERWVEQLDQAPPEMRPPILEIIEGFAARVPESDAERFFDRWWQKALSASAPMQAGWARAVHSAACCLPLQATERILFDCVGKVIKSPETSNSALAYSLCEIARRIPEGKGYTIISRLMTRMNGRSPEVQDTLALAVVGAAERIDLADAGKLVRRLQAAMEKRFSGVAGKLADALEETCRRIPEEDACRIALSILERMATAKGELDAALARAVLASAKRVHERDVENLASRILECFPEFDESVQDTLERASFAVMTRCPDMDVRPLVAGWDRRLNDGGSPTTSIILATLAAQKQTVRFAFQAADGWLHEMVTRDGDAIELYAEAARMAAGRIDPSEAPSAVEHWRRLAGEVRDPELQRHIWNSIWAATARLSALDARTLVDQYSASGEDAFGLRAASYQPEIAARIAAVDDQGAYRFDFRWRTDPELLLDQSVEFAPSRIRELISTASKNSNINPSKTTITSREYKMSASTSPVRAAPPRPDILLVTVNEHETRAVHDAFLAATEAEGSPFPSGGRLYHNLGKINGTSVYHVISEMGSGGSGGMQQTVEKAISALEPGAVIAVGIAFGVNEEKQEIGEILVSRLLRLYELQRVGRRSKIALRGARPDASPRLLSHFRTYQQVKWTGAKVRFGVLLTGEKLVDNVDYRDQLVRFEAEAEGGEMEGAGLYVSSYDNKVDWIVVKAICDWADGNKGVDKESRQKLAAKNAAEFVVLSLGYAPLKRQGSQRAVSAPEVSFASSTPVDSTALSPGDSEDLSRRRDTAGRNSSILQVIVDLEHPDSFDDSLQHIFQHGVANLLGIRPEQVRIAGIQPANSVRITIALPVESADKFLSIFVNNKDLILAALHPLTVLDIRRGTDETPQQIQGRSESANAGERGATDEIATPQPKLMAPKAFISYSWDDPTHIDWVKQLAVRLRADGVDVTLDRWHAAPGDQIPAFMERAVRENDFVIAVCTPLFKERSDRRGGGVGYEGDIMTAYAFTGSNTRKFIPILRRGRWEEVAPTWLLGRARIDLIGEPYSESEYEELLRTLHSAREEAPPIGPRPNFGYNKRSQVGPAPAIPLAESSTPRHQSSVATGKQIKVLLLSANPIDSPLNIDEEFRAIDQKIRGSEHRDHVDLVKHGAVRLEDVAGLLMRHKPHVVHFSSHGATSGIALTGPDGKGHLVPPDALANIFKALKDNVRVVLLNACDSAPQAKAIVREVDCAVGMSDEIEDGAAVAFAAAFYEALGYGRSVQAAFDLALVQLEGFGADRSLARLHKRRTVKPSEIILVSPPRPR